MYAAIPDMFFIFIQCIVFLLCIFIIVLMFHYDKAAYEQKLIILRLVTVLIYSTGCVLEINSRTLRDALTAFKISSIGIAFSSVMMLIFICHSYKWTLKKRIISIFLFLGLVYSFLMLSCERHPFFITSIKYKRDGARPTLLLSFTPLYYFFAAVDFAIQAATFFIAVRTYYREEKEERHKVHFFIIGTFLPLITFPLYFLHSYRYFNPTPAILLLSCIIIIRSMYKNSLFDVVQTARTAVIDNMPQAFIILDRRYHFLDANPSALTLFPELEDIEHDISIQKTSPFLYSIISKGPESGFQMKDHYYECQVSNILKQGTIQGYSICIIDQTPHYLNTKKLIEMKDAAYAASQAKSDFLANMSHEIRTPMNAIIGMSEIALRHDLDDELRHNIEDIRNSGRSLLDIINNILDLSKIESGKLELIEDKYSLKHLLYAVYSIISTRLFDKPVKFITQLDPMIPDYLTGDLVRVREIFLNLLGNAVKYTKEGSIFLKLGFEWIDPESTQLNNQKIRLHLEVSDTGIGIKETELGKIFGSYSQVDTRKNRSITGTGLGLAITKNLAELMNGSIRVESEYGKGSTFFATIEQTVYDSIRICQESISRENIQQFKEKDENDFRSSFIMPDARILIVDDLEVNLLVAKGLLEPFQMNIDTACSGQEAIEKIKQTSYDIIFMDHMMPELDGVDTTQIIRKSGYTHLPVIALTANALIGAKQYFEEHGFNDFLAKPIDFKQMTSILHKWIPSEKIKNKVKKNGSDSNETDDRINQMPGQANTLLSGLTLPDVDIPAGLASAGGRENLYLTILKSFTKDAKDCLSFLSEQGITNLPLFQIKVHGMKSVSASIGAKKLSRQAKLLEQAAKEQSISFIQEKLPAFQQGLNLLYHQVSALLDQLTPKEDLPAATETETRLVLTSESLNELKQAFSDFDLDAMEDQIHNLLDAASNEKERAFLKELWEFSENLDYDLGITRIDEYLG